MTAPQDIAFAPDLPRELEAERALLGAVLLGSADGPAALRRVRHDFSGSLRLDFAGRLNRYQEDARV